MLLKSEHSKNSGKRLHQAQILEHYIRKFMLYFPTASSFRAMIPKHLAGINYTATNTYIYCWGHIALKMLLKKVNFFSNILYWDLTKLYYDFFFRKLIYMLYYAFFNIYYDFFMKWLYISFYSFLKTWWWKQVTV